jgi:hypothetical protein
MWTATAATAPCHRHVCLVCGVVARVAHRERLVPTHLGKRVAAQSAHLAIRHAAIVAAFHRHRCVFGRQWPSGWCETAQPDHGPGFLDMQGKRGKARVAAGDLGSFSLKLDKRAA